MLFSFASLRFFDVFAACVFEVLRFFEFCGLCSLSSIVGFCGFFGVFGSWVFRVVALPGTDEENRNGTRTRGEKSERPNEWGAGVRTKWPCRERPWRPKKPFKWGPRRGVPVLLSEAERGRETKAEDGGEEGVRSKTVDGEPRNGRGGPLRDAICLGIRPYRRSKEWRWGKAEW
ncbi:hypothetical protein C8R45DRAFT_583143 [Mycena sanguinolenta]|nr:hypothetical protein C8R45DRAFT_583143 [Mycena sanguinolenta]